MSSQSDVLAPGLVIDGAVEPGGDGTYAVTNPARPTEIVLQAPAASSAQLDRAVAAARRASRAWAATDIEIRVAAVVAAAQAGVAAVESSDLARLLTREHGKVYWEAVFDATTMGFMSDGFAPMAVAALAPSVRDASTVDWAPHGVVASILPFNWPVAVMANKVLPALFAGNTAVVKVPPSCPGTALAVGAAMAAALPPGVLNVVNGPGPELGAALVGHVDVDMVSFTGGVSTGQAVMRAASSSTRPVVLELGGNDAAILAPDFEVDDEVAARLFDATFVTSGQVCMAIKRLYVHRDRLAQTVDALAARMCSVVVGDGLAEEVTMGPVHLAARDRVEQFIAEAAATGAEVVRPGALREEDRGGGGYFVSPALVVAPPPDARIVTEEQFAPALPILPYDDLEDAVSAANDTPFGLCASIWSGDDAVVASVAPRLEAGTVFVNAHGMSSIDLHSPMGGWKQSGFGLELGPEGMQAFARPRVTINRAATVAAGGGA